MIKTSLVTPEASCSSNDEFLSLSHGLGFGRSAVWGEFKGGQGLTGRTRAIQSWCPTSGFLSHRAPRYHTIVTIDSKPTIGIKQSDCFDVQSRTKHNSCTTSEPSCFEGHHSFFTGLLNIRVKPGSYTTLSVACYSWSWKLVVILINHPSTSEIHHQLTSQLID